MHQVYRLSDDIIYEMHQLALKDGNISKHVVDLVWNGLKSDTPHIKIFKSHFDDSEYVKISISVNPEIIGGNWSSIKTKDVVTVFEWVQINRTVLMDIWNTRTGSEVKANQLLSRLTKLI